MDAKEGTGRRSGALLACPPAPGRSVTPGPSNAQAPARGRLGPRGSHADAARRQAVWRYYSPTRGLDQSLQPAYLGDEDVKLASKFDDVFTRPEGIVSCWGGRVLVGLWPERDAFSAQPPNDRQP